MRGGEKDSEEEEGKRVKEIEEKEEELGAVSQP